MKAVLAYVLLGLSAFLLSLALLAPATLVTNWLGVRLPGFSVQTVEGTAADGSARGVRWRGVRIERLTWRWRPPALLAGRLAFKLQADDPEIQLTGSAAVGLNRRLHLQDFNGRLPLAKLSAAAGQSKAPLQGILELDLREADLNDAGQPLTAVGVARLRELRAVLGQAFNIGDFTVRLTPAQPEGVQGAIKDHGGPLALDGALHLAPDGRYRFNGRAAVRDAGNQALRQAMGLLGPPGDDGRWTLNFSGVLAR